MSSILEQVPELIDIPAAWLGSELTKTPEFWHSALSSDEVGELHDAASTFLNSGQDIGALNRDNFVLPTLGARFYELQQTLIKGRGFELISGLPIEQFSREISATIFLGVGAHLGCTRSQNGKGHVLGHVRDVGLDISDPKVRIYQTTERQSFHTDSVDVVGLLCLKEAMEGGRSMLVSTVSLYNEMRRRRPDLAATMFGILATDRRGEVPEGGKPWFEVPVLNWHKGMLTGLYQRNYIKSAERFPEAPQLSEKHIEALDLFDQLANDPKYHLSMELKPGDMQFVYNHSLLHDRTSFRDWPELEKRRHLLRLWLAVPGDRELPPHFTQRYGSIEIGDRGGIITKDTKLTVEFD